MVAHFGLDVVQAYMRHVQDNAEEAVRRLLSRLEDGALPRRDGPGHRGRGAHHRRSRQRARRKVDFTGTSAQQPNNFNAPEPVTRAAVLYTFRVMVDEPIPMNAGCLKPIEIVIPEGSMLQPDLSGRRRRRQRRDEPDRHQRAVRRARRPRLGAGHDEQPHLRQRPAAVLRDAVLGRARPAPASTAPPACTCT